MTEPRVDNPDTPAREPRTLFRGKHWFWLVALVGAACDWWSKGAAFAYHFEAHGLSAEKFPLELFEFGGVRFGLVREYNAGMAFGLLQETQDAWVYLSLARTAAIVFLLWLLLRTAVRARGHQIALGMLVAGATGNLLDNLFHLAPHFEHTVRDFVYIATASGHLPALNLADILVALGALGCIAAVICDPNRRWLGRRVSG